MKSHVLFSLCSERRWFMPQVYCGISESLNTGLVRLFLLHNDLSLAFECVFPSFIILSVILQNVFRSIAQNIYDFEMLLWVMIIWAHQSWFQHIFQHAFILYLTLKNCAMLFHILINIAQLYFQCASIPNSPIMVSHFSVVLLWVTAHAFSPKLPKILFKSWSEQIGQSQLEVYYNEMLFMEIKDELAVLTLFIHSFSLSLILSSGIHWIE